MSMKLSEISQIVYNNAKEHGWWEKDRPLHETFALIHSELSEALEEYRNNRGMVWHDEERHNKPEGIAVELIDAVIRVLDYLGKIDAKTDEDYTVDQLVEIGRSTQYFKEISEGDCALVVAEAHCGVSKAYSEAYESMRVEMLVDVCILLLTWIAENGYEPESLLIEKHEYNVTRPYRHGNKAC